MTRPLIALVLSLAACNLPSAGDPCVSDFDCGNYVCDIQVGATEGVCADPPATPGTSSTGSDDTGP